MKKKKEVKIRKPVAKKPTKVIASRKDKERKRRPKHRNLLNQSQDH